MLTFSLFLADFPVDSCANIDCVHLARVKIALDISRGYIEDPRLFNFHDYDSLTPIIEYATKKELEEDPCYGDLTVDEKQKLLNQLHEQEITITDLMIEIDSKTMAIENQANYVKELLKEIEHLQHIIQEGRGGELLLLAPSVATENNEEDGGVCHSGKKKKREEPLEVAIAEEEPKKEDVPTVVATGEEIIPPEVANEALEEPKTKETVLSDVPTVVATGPEVAKEALEEPKTKETATVQSDVPTVVAAGEEIVPPEVAKDALEEPKTKETATVQSDVSTVVATGDALEERKEKGAPQKKKTAKKKKMKFY
jgi:hypothetical protein